MFIKAISIFMGITLLLGINGCKTSDKEETTYYPTNTWRTSTPEEQGMDSEKLVELLKFVNTEEFTEYSGFEYDVVDSILVIRNGYAVMDTYFYPFTSEDTNHIFSCSKSVISLLVGIAIDKGYIKSVDETLLSFFPDREVKNMSEDKMNITLRDLLSMTSGLDSKDYDADTLEGLIECFTSSNHIQSILDAPMRSKPGEEFYYSNLTTYLLSAIIQKTTGQSTIEFADKYLFTPLDIKNYKIYSSNEGLFLGFKGLSISSFDLSKIGYMCLKNGKWKGKQIVSESWIKESTEMKTSANGVTSIYGYQWWIDENNPNQFIAWGSSGKYLIVNKEKDLIVVIISDVYDDLKIYDLFKKFISPSILSDEQILENPAVNNELIKLEEQAELPRTIKDETDIVPEIMEKIIGKSYEIAVDGEPFFTISFTKSDKGYTYEENVNLIGNNENFDLIFVDPNDANNSPNRLTAVGISRDTFERRHLDLILENNQAKGETHWGIEEPIMQKVEKHTYKPLTEKEKASFEKSFYICPASGDKTITDILEPIRQEYKLPAIGAAIVDSNGLVAEGVVGVRKLGTQVPVQLNDLWSIGSCTKAMTATLVAKLVEDGKLKWDTTIGDVFPELAKDFNPDFRDITILQLLSHHAGLERDLFDDEKLPPGVFETYNLLDRIIEIYGEECDLTQSVNDQRRDILLDFSQKELQSIPGEEFHYSNIDYIIIGSIIDKITGKSFEEAMQEMILKPLNMNNTFFESKNKSSSILQPYPHEYTGRPLNISLPPFYASGGIMYCSISDWAKFIIDQLRGEEGKKALLKPEFYKKLHEEVGGKSALGWKVIENALTHTGTDTLNYADVVIYKDDKFAILVVTNIGENFLISSSQCEKAVDKIKEELKEYYQNSIKEKE